MRAGWRSANLWPFEMRLGHHCLSSVVSGISRGRKRSLRAHAATARSPARKGLAAPATGGYAPGVPDPKLTREGNLRLACLAGNGWPADPLLVGASLRRSLADQGGSPYGPVQLFVAGAPGDEPPAGWEVHLGTAVSGMPRPGALVDGQRVMVEDYRDLVALSIAHHGPVRELGQTWRRLADHGTALGHRLRPYWRVSLRRRQLADGNILPASEVAVFLDR